MRVTNSVKINLCIKKWVDAHANLPSRARWIAKADVAPLESNQAGSRVGPPFNRRAFYFLLRITGYGLPAAKQTDRGDLIQIAAPCWRRFKTDPLCRLNIDQGLLLT